MPDATAPFWAAPTILSAAIAALGYVGKLTADFWQERRDTARKRQARLADLLAMLSAGDVAFDVQSALRNRLWRLLTARRPDLRGLSFDRLFAVAYGDGMTEQERELHTLIRTYTVHMLKPSNDRLLDWIRTDTHFRGLAPTAPRFGDLVRYLPKLEQHLLLWNAKYDAWIPEHPEHCLVYLVDEERHGLEFPPNGTRLVATLLGHEPPSRPDIPTAVEEEIAASEHAGPHSSESSESYATERT